MPLNRLNSSVQKTSLNSASKIFESKNTGTLKKFVQSKARNTVCTPYSKENAKHSNMTRTRSVAETQSEFMARLSSTAKKDLKNPLLSKDSIGFDSTFSLNLSASTNIEPSNAPPPM